MNPSAAMTCRSGQGRSFASLASTIVGSSRAMTWSCRWIRQWPAAITLRAHSDCMPRGTTIRNPFWVASGWTGVSRLIRIFARRAQRRNLGAPIACQPAPEERWIHHRIHERRPDPWVATPTPRGRDDDRADRHRNRKDYDDPAHLRLLHGHGVGCGVRIWPCPADGLGMTGPREAESASPER